MNHLIYEFDCYVEFIEKKKVECAYQGLREGRKRGNFEYAFSFAGGKSSGDLLHNSVKYT